MGTYPIFLSIECRDHSRPADVLWIEGVAKKHEHLFTSKLVLWSRSGFTKAAALKARALKIEAISQAEALQADWARLARELIGGQVQHVTPSYTAFIDVNQQEGDPRRLEQVESAAWYNGDGTQIGTVQALIQSIANNPQTRTVVLDHTSLGSGNFYAELEPPEPWFTDLPEGGQAQIRRIGVSIETLTEKVELDTASAVSGGKVLTLASAKLTAGTLAHQLDDFGVANFQSDRARCLAIGDGFQIHTTAGDKEGDGQLVTAPNGGNKLALVEVRQAHGRELRARIQRRPTRQDSRWR